MSEARWYVVAEDEPLARDKETADIWTVSLDPNFPGWQTDSGYPGYGLPKALAKELADAANEAWYRRQKEARDE